MSALKSELPTYLAAAEDVAADVLPLTWWECNAEKLPSWGESIQESYFLSAIFHLCGEGFFHSEQFQ